MGFNDHVSRDVAVLHTLHVHIGKYKLNSEQTDSHLESLMIACVIELMKGSLD